jgi:general stress protein 26
MNPSDSDQVGANVPDVNQNSLTVNPVMPTIPLPLSGDNTNPVVTQPIQSSFQIADDKDIIEPEWVSRAKSIITANKEDPYKQSEELTAFKADYMQKRYNKNIKLK